MSGITMAPAAGEFSSGRVYLQDYGLYDNSDNTKVVTCTFRVDSDGDVYGHLSSVLQSHYTWLLTGAVGDYEVRATLVAGTLSSGTLDTWLSCSVDRTWQTSIYYLDGPTDYVTLDIEIRDATSLAVVASCRITCSAETTYF